MDSLLLLDDDDGNEKREVISQLIQNDVKTEEKSLDEISIGLYMNRNSFSKNEEYTISLERLKEWKDLLLQSITYAHANKRPHIIWNEIFETYKKEENDAIPKFIVDELLENCY